MRFPATLPSPDFRDLLERRGWREYPATINVRVRRYHRGKHDIVAVEFNGDILHIYKPVTSQKQAQEFARKVTETGRELKWDSPQKETPKRNLKGSRKRRATGRTG